MLSRYTDRLDGWGSIPSLLHSVQTVLEPVQLPT
jgi:hypothetical protein